MPQTLHIGIAACEPSGDLLGSELIQALRTKYSQLEFSGIAGPKMRAAGCEAVIRTEQLSIMGLIEVLSQLRRLLKLRKQIIRYFLDNPPDIFIGIDSPDFNFGVEQCLKKSGIPIVHYVSPSIWAWRENRVKRIAGCVDLMLTLLPFEKIFYQRHNIAVEYVGHPLADTIPENQDRSAARNKLGIDRARPCIAFLPGSRVSEIKRMLPVFIKTMQYCQQKKPLLSFVMPVAMPQLSTYIRQQIPSGLDLHLVDGNAQTTMVAANVALVASGTATLECLLVKRPMVVTYIMHPVSFYLANRLLTVPYVSLPNNLAGKKIVPEYLQRSATANTLGKSLLELLDNADLQRVQTDCFYSIHKELKKSASSRAAEIILEKVGHYA
jgi:lipid-A-disaccharide synthase